MKYIPVSRGKWRTAVDDDMYDVLSKSRWHNKKGYVCRVVRNEKGRWTIQYMHRIILQTPKGMETDHIDRDKMNNQRANLRAVTGTQNKWNRGMMRSNKSGFRGVCFAKDTGKWQAAIRINSKQVYLGQYTSPQEASRVYEEKAREVRGQYA